MHLGFVPTETTWDYFAATRSYVKNHGRPVAFYSDKHSVFRVNGVDDGGTETQFGRALSALNIDLIASPHDAHRALRLGDNLDEIFSMQSKRKVSRSYSFRYENRVFVIDKRHQNLGLWRKRIQIFHRQDGHITVRHRATRLTYTIAEQRRPEQGRIVDHKALDQELDAIKLTQRLDEPPFRTKIPGSNEPQQGTSVLRSIGDISKKF